MPMLGLYSIQIQVSNRITEMRRYTQKPKSVYTNNPWRGHGSATAGLAHALLRYPNSREINKLIGGRS